MLSLINPNESFRTEWSSVTEKWDDSRKRPRIFFQEDFDKFLQIIEQLSLWDDEIRQLAKSSVLLLVWEWDKKILWCTWIRHHIRFSADALYNWHIWYWVPPDERWKWYATEILRLSLIEAKRIWLEKILIACDDDNSASAHVIEKNGWVFESFNLENWVKRRRYWIPLW